MNVLEKSIALFGRSIAWLTLLMVLITFTVVVFRYGFSQGWIWVQESVTYLHAMVFMLTAAWALQTDGHVRVDIFYRTGSERFRAIVNLAGSLLFLVPFCVFMFWVGWGYVAPSWQLLEGSREAGGIPLVYLLKSLILIMPSLLLLQAIPIVSRAWQTLRSPAAAV